MRLDLTKIIVVLLLSSTGFMKASDVQKFATLPLDEAEQWINGTSDNELRQKYLNVAVESKRLDLVRRCFQNQYTALEVPPTVAKLPETAYKNQLILMMLRTQTNYWRSELSIGSFEISRLDQPFISALSKYLPDVPRTATLLSTQKARLAIGAEMEKMMRLYPDGAPPGQPGHEESVARISAALENTDPRADEKDPNSFKFSKRPLTNAPSSDSRYSRWILVAAGILVVGALMIWRKKRR